MYKHKPEENQLGIGAVSFLISIFSAIYMFCVNMFVLYRISKKMYSLYSNDPRFKNDGCIIKRGRWLLQMNELVAFVTRRLERGTKINIISADSTSLCFCVCY